MGSKANAAAKKGKATTYGLAVGYAKLMAVFFLCAFSFIAAAKAGLLSSAIQRPLILFLGGFGALVFIATNYYQFRIYSIIRSQTPGENKSDFKQWQRSPLIFACLFAIGLGLMWLVAAKEVPKGIPVWIAALLGLSSIIGAAYGWSNRESIISQVNKQKTSPALHKSATKATTFGFTMLCASIWLFSILNVALAKSFVLGIAGVLWSYIYYRHMMMRASLASRAKAR